MDVAQPLIGNMSINLRGHNTAMAQEFLNGAQIRALRQQIRGHGVAQGMRRGKQRHTGNYGILFHQSFNGTGGKPFLRVFARPKVNK